MQPSNTETAVYIIAVLIFMVMCLGAFVFRAFIELEKEDNE